MDTIFLGNKREMFWDSYLVDEEKTTAFPRLMEPAFKEVCFNFNQGKELFSISYPSIVKDENGYKMYYITGGLDEKNLEAYLFLIESKDGINWTRPHLNIFDHPEFPVNNMVIDHGLDNYFVFYDTNPACPADEKYKAVGEEKVPDENGNLVFGLYCHTSPDGYHFKRSHLMTKEGRFDSLNTAHWDGEKYVAYIRNCHLIPEEFDEKINKFEYERIVDKKLGIRDVRVMYSSDFKTWTTPKILEFYDGKDYPIYTNNVMQYERAPHIWVGFPTRYTERPEWTQNEEEILSRDVKEKASARYEKRSGIAVTDCIFMFSRDAEKWYRYNEAFITPGYETKNNWVYGDCYAAYNFIDSGKETYYMYTFGGQWDETVPSPLFRYEIRKDGFACYMSDCEEKVLVTKPLIFEGKDLHINFATSPYGYIKLDILDKNGNELSNKESYEIFGNHIDRKVSFADGTDFSEYAGKEICLRFKMRDAKIFSLKFE